MTFACAFVVNIINQTRWYQTRRVYAVCVCVCERVSARPFPRLHRGASERPLETSVTLGVLYLVAWETAAGPPLVVGPDSLGPNG